ncbi:MAG: DUF3341 domain-containing protein [Phycisphaerae bacterium]|nr:DUF3341 domain-containing protein [Phycisphaerae bacterium]
MTTVESAMGTGGVAENERAQAQTLFGLLAQFEDVGTLMSAAEKVRDAGFKQWDCYTPFPVHGLDKAMGIKATRLPWFVLIAGLTGGTLGLLMCWWTNATSMDMVPYALRGYDYTTSGKPIFSLPANIPPIFEMVILFSAITAFLCVFALNLLPRFSHPAFGSRRFARVTQDRFFIEIRAEDEAFNAPEARQLLEGLGATTVEEIKDSTNA